MLTNWLWMSAEMDYELLREFMEEVREEEREEREEGLPAPRWTWFEGVQEGDVGEEEGMEGKERRGWRHLQHGCQVRENLKKSQLSTRRKSCCSAQVVAVRHLQDYPVYLACNAKHTAAKISCRSVVPNTAEDKLHRTYSQGCAPRVPKSCQPPHRITEHTLMTLKPFTAT